MKTTTAYKTISSPRLDKWLWAARFFKTRKQCQEAITGGKIHCQGQRCKAGQIVYPKMQLVIHQGYDKKIVIVKMLSDKRGNAACASSLYEETADSIAARESTSLNRRLTRETVPDLSHKPNKKERRQLQQLRE